MLDCINVFQDLQCIVSQEDFQHKILDCSTLLTLLSLHTSRAERGKKLLELFISAQVAAYKCYIKNTCSENF